MARGEKLLTPMELKKLVETVGRHKDGGGLELRVDDHVAKGKVEPTRRQRWVFRFTLKGRDRDMGLGAYPDVSLKLARERRDAARLLIQSGRDPIAERAAEKVPVRTIPTFAEAAKAYIEKHGGGWNRVHRRQWELTTGTYCDQIASKPVNEITTLDIDRLLAVVHESAPVTAHRLRTRIAAVIDEIVDVAPLVGNSGQSGWFQTAAAEAREGRRASRCNAVCRHPGTGCRSEEDGQHRCPSAGVLHSERDPNRRDAGSQMV